MQKAKWVLLVHEDAENSEQFKSALKVKGYSTIVSRKVGDALTKLGNQRFSCVIIDHNAKDNTGVHIVHQMRESNAKDSFNFETPIILLSEGLDPSTARILAHRVQKVLIKPITAEVLVNCCEDVVAGASAKSDAPTAELFRDLSASCSILEKTIHRLKGLLPEHSVALQEILVTLENTLAVVSARLHTLQIRILS